MGGAVSIGLGQLAAILLALLVVTFAPPAIAREEVLTYVVDITLAPDGSAEIVETIEANVEGDIIKRGLYRDLVEIPSEDSALPRLNVLSVERDGAPETFSLVDAENGYRRVYMGKEDVFLDHGIHTWVLRYTLRDVAELAGKNVALNWNATGSWGFDILKSEVVVHAPPRAMILTWGGTIEPRRKGLAGLSINRQIEGGVRLIAPRPIAMGEYFRIDASMILDAVPAQ